ncbi:MAG: hypothetical protein MJ104_05990 [Lachnospiraceae bacterium]|nr:hypothetical protein [Lachnospiraceae bacterium]
MAKMTSAYANKMIRKLKEDKEYWRRREQESYLYVASLDEEPVIPEYDYSEVAAEIAAIDEKIAKLKHAINLSNATNELEVAGESFSIDTILVKMAQMNRRKEVLDNMRKQQPKVRISSGYYSTKKAAPEYQYINYDLDLIKAEYEKVDALIAEYQIALDKYNQTFEFDVNL